MNDVVIFIQEDNFRVHRGASFDPPLLTIIEWEDVLERCIQFGRIHELYLYFHDVTRIPESLPDCAHLFFMYQGDEEVTIPFPKGILSVKSLCYLEIMGKLRLLSIHPGIRNVGGYMNVDNFPYWLCDMTPPVWLLYTDNLQGKRNLDNLIAILCQGLSHSGHFNQWLTQGLYDPRLFFEIRDFLLYNFKNAVPSD